MVVSSLQAVGRTALRGVAAVGRGGHLAVGAVRALRKVDIWGPLFVPQLAAVGVASVPIALFISAFTGIVLAIQASYTFTGTVPLYFVGALVGKTIILELGPVLTGLALAGRVGANIAAELGTMRVTEQIDALEAMGINSVAYLVIPRVLAGIVMLPVLYIAACFVGIGGGILVADLGGWLAPQEFIQGARSFFRPFDGWFGVIKAAVIGFVITSVSCYYGYFTRGGAEGVGRSTTQAAVMSCVFILLADLLLAILLL